MAEMQRATAGIVNNIVDAYMELSLSPGVEESHMDFWVSDSNKSPCWGARMEFSGESFDAQSVEYGKATKEWLEGRMNFVAHDGKVTYEFDRMGEEEDEDGQENPFDILSIEVVFPNK